jgi:acetolactate synthase-1/2/3 large subunit
MDLQAKEYPYMADYMPSSDIVPVAQRPVPDPVIVDRLVDMIAEAEKPIIIAGRGAVRSGARDALVSLAERCGALMATSLMGKGLFDGVPYAMDIAGAFASDFARERFAEADLVIGVGAALGHYTTEGGYLYPGARVAQIDTNPRGLWQGVRTADLHVRADAKAAAESIAKRMDERGVSRTGFRTGDMLAQIAADVPDSKQFTVQPNMVDPRKVILELDKVIPHDWDIVVGGGHYFSFAMTHLKGRAPERYHVVNDFGAIGSGLPAAIGIAAARNDGKVALIEGDGSLLMHVQELETVRRQGIKMLINIMNDGGYGAEYHKFRAHGIKEVQAIHGRGDLAGVATGFGLRGATVNQLGGFTRLFDDHQSANIATLWDVHTDDRIPSRAYRRVHYGEA